MFYLGLIVAICFVPGYVGASIPVQWAVLSCILPLGLWRRGSIGPVTWAGLSLLLWSAISLLWTPNVYDSAYGLWIFSICALALWLGTTIHDFRPLLAGLAAGVTVSSAIAIAQALGFTPVMSSSSIPSGLFYNSTVLGATSALLIVALLTHHQFKWVPGLLPALLLSQSRGAFVILGAVFLTNFLRPLWVLAICLVGFAALTISPSPSDIQRLMLWGVAGRELNLWGHGIGSFATYLYYNPNEYYLKATGLFQAGYVHNDYIQLWFELGIGAVAAYFIYAICLTQRESTLWSTFFGFAILGLFYFPLYCPLTAFIGMVAAGRLTAEWHHAWHTRLHRRYDRLLWNPY